jgi:hypothetical protein
MAMLGRTTSAVRGCMMPISGPNNLCDVHRIPGAAMAVSDTPDTEATDTMVITIWYAEHEDGVGIILLNDLGRERTKSGIEN